MAKKKNLIPNAVQPVSRTRILCIETATDVSSIALFEDGNLITLQENHAHRTHARLVTVMIQRMLHDVGMQPADLSAVCVARGPGSYTGLRVGVSVAKGLCMALDIPLLSLGSLEALALSVSDLASVLDAWVCPMIDARRMEVFTQLFDTSLHPIDEPAAMIVSEGAFQAMSKEKKLILLGDGAAKCRPLLAGQDHVILLEQRISSAASMGQAAHERFMKGRHEDLVTFEPFYLKEFVATLSQKKVL